jgi:hypothetical protein
VKLPKIGGGEAALFDYARSGPHFGADGLVIGNYTCMHMPCTHDIQYIQKHTRTHDRAVATKCHGVVCRA